MKEPMKHILHIEDNPDFQFYIQTMLEEVVNVTSVSSVKEARETILQKEFDLFLLDLFLPDGSGSRLAKELKEQFPYTPIVMLSAHDVASDYVDNVEATFIKTTLDFNVLVKRIKSLLRISGAR